MRVADQRVSSSFDDESILIGETKEPDPKTGQLASVTVRGTPEVLVIEAFGYHWSWLEFRELTFITQQKGDKIAYFNSFIEKVKQRLKDNPKCRDLYDNLDPNSTLDESVYPSSQYLKIENFALSSVTNSLTIYIDVVRESQLHI